MKETITWISTEEQKPDSDITVLCWADDEYFCGWWDSEKWHDTNAMNPIKVEYWAIPNGPVF